MPDTLANKFIIALDPVRDRLYTLALAKEATPAKAELALQKAVRTLFPEYAKDPYIDVSGGVEQAVSPPADANSPLLSAAVALTPAMVAPMPADVWARLAAAVQLAAAKMTPTPGATALNPDSVLLSPDPLLAPKKQVAPDDDDLASPSRFLFAATVALLIGIGLTIYILTRPATPHVATQPTTTQAAPHE